MAAKVVSAIITCIFDLAIGVVIFAVMIIAMNGFSGSDAQWGILLYLILALLTTILMSVAAAIFAGRLAKRAMHAAVITLISSGIFTVVGAVLISLSGFAGVIAADVVRRNF